MTLSKQKPLNILSNLIEERFGLEARPTDEKLSELGLTRKRFTRILNNSGKPITIEEAKSLSDWLKVEIGQFVS
ncbi:hypothetical protein [Persicobacter sp. CCB-QB2]|uniref:hypothetical protein n=1 Tax=Persicobacter sp. CCB-QB2 TaxID=1561025 RepID=UPI0006A968AC|nr:hypothetical protein [Persicobacter sp. CCB-QB2]